MQATMAVRELTPSEIARVAGGPVPVAWGIRVGGGAALGAIGATLNEVFGDGLQWEDAGKIAVGAAVGAGAGGLGGVARRVESTGRMPAKKDD